MKTKLGIGILLLATLMACAQTNNLTSLLQQGLFEEQANRNLDAAIADYQSLATQFDQDRKIAATAIFRLGECYRAQGKTNEAATQYQRILQDFSDQTTLATLSQQNLAGMGRVGVNSTEQNNADARLWNQLKDLSSSQLQKTLPTLVSDPVLDQLLQSRNEMTVKLAQLKLDFAPDSLPVKKQQAALDVVRQQIDEKISGIMQGMKLRAVLAQPSFHDRLQKIVVESTTGAAATTDDEDKEIARIGQMIKNSPDLINAPLASDPARTPLIKAAFNGWLKVATYLLNHNADVNKAAWQVNLSQDLSSGGQVPPLLAAVVAGNKAMTQFLIQHGADVNFQDEQGDTPLHLAVEKGFQAVTEVLLASNAEVNIQNRLGATPLFSAVANGQLNLVKMLLKAGAKVNVENNRGITPLSYAVGGNSPEIVKMLLAANADPDGGKLDRPLSGAVFKKNITAAKLLLQAGANPNAVGKSDWPGVGKESITPMWLAVHTDQLPMVQLLLKFKANPNDFQTDGRSLLFGALSDTNILEALLDAGAKVDARDATDKTGDNRILGWTPLLVAVEHNFPASVVEILLKHGANPNARDEAFGQTPLHWISGWGGERLPKPKVVELLLDYKADPNMRNNGGRTPLDLLKMRERVENPSSQRKALLGQIVDLLHQHGALDILPDWSSITISRPSAKFSYRVFDKGTNNWNQVSLFDVLGLQYNLIANSKVTRYAASPYSKSSFAHDNSCAFPDFANVVIRHPLADGKKWEARKVDLAHALDTGDCSADIMLQWGDVVEIPEADHVINQQWTGLTTNQLMTLKHCLTRHLQITVNGRTTSFVVSPQVTITPGHYTVYSDGEYPDVKLVTGEPFMLWPVLDESKTLLASSDLSRIKIKRTDAAGKIHEWTVDCSNPNSPPNFWLRDGDVIEVPEKP